MGDELNKNRLLSITSLNQLVIGLCCLRKNTNKKEKYNDYLIINNVMVGDSTVNSIKKIAKFWSFKKVIDFRNKIESFEKSQKNTSSFKWYTGKDYEKSRFLIDELKKELCVKKIDEIYLRYKFGPPEHLLIETFKSSKILMFEDGLGDYVLKSKTTKKILLKSHLLKFIYFFKRKSFYKSFVLEKKYLKRISEKYTLINDNEGHLKNRYLQSKINDFLNIKEDYIIFLSEIKNKIWNKVNIKKDSILCMVHNYSLNPVFKMNVDGEIEYYRYIVKKFKNLSPNSEIILKLHPNATDDMRKIYKEEFKEKIVKEIDEIPAEILLLDGNFKYITGATSTTLIYAVNIFNIESFFFNKPIKNNQTIAEFKTLKRLGVKEII